MKTSAPAAAKRARTLAGTSPSTDDGRAHTLSLYESALRLMQEGKYQKAHDAFEAMLASAPGDLAERIRMYISACLQQIAKKKTDFTSDEERYDYAISLLNEGNYEDARAQLKHNKNQHDRADYAFYGLAVLASMTGDGAEVPRASHRGHSPEFAEPHPGTFRLRLPGHGRRPPLH